MKDEENGKRDVPRAIFILHPSSFILHPFFMADFFPNLGV